MGHADGFRALGLAGIDGNDAAPDGFCHVGAGVDGHHQNGGDPDIGELHGVIGKIGKAVVDEYRLQHHGGAPEYLDVHPDNDSDEPQ